MRVVIEGAQGELRRRSVDLAEAFAKVYADVGLDLGEVLKSLRSLDDDPPDGALGASTLRPRCLRESVDARLQWYADAVLPSMQRRIMEVLR